MVTVTGMVIVKTEMEKMQMTRMAQPILPQSHLKKVNNALATDDKYKASIPDAYDQAFDAFKKAYDADPNNKRMMLDLYKTGFVAYEGVANRACLLYTSDAADERS